MSTIAIDATYVLDPQPSGVSVYSRRLIESLSEIESHHHFLIGYRLSRWKRRDQTLRFTASPRRGNPGFSTCFFQEPWTFWLPQRAELFHSLAQRPAPFRFRNEIVTVHDAFPITSRDYSTAEFQHKFTRLLIEAIRRAALVITPSHYTAEQLTQHAGVTEEKIRVIPEGVDLPQHLLPPDARRRAREDRVGAGNEMILVVGVIQHRKNTVGALRALACLPNRYRMVIAGGDGYGSDAVHSFIARSGLANRVAVLGHVEPAVLSALYQAASVLLFPSFEEGFGLPVLEAMAHGLPVVLSSTASLPEVGGEAALYTDPRDESQIAAQVLRAVEDGDLREQLAAAGLTRAKEFSWQKAARRTLDVYAEVLGA
jgi:glycosyltransferase involved in cell wall biosynthesis